ncbi:MAG TPA: hypothetical protein VGK30_08475 [Candidatus Binatia bacterium]
MRDLPLHAAHQERRLQLRAAGSRRTLTRALALGAALLLGAGIASQTRAADDAAKCQGSIVRAAAAYTLAKASALQKCEDGKVKGKLARDVVCRDEPLKTAPAIAKAGTKLRSAIVKACAGKDKVCGTHDADGSEPALAAIGWDIGQCPNFASGGCANAIADCNDIPTCIECVDEAAVDQALALSYAALAPSDPKDKAQKPLNKCQATIGSAGAKLLAAKTKTLAKCWAAVTKTASGACPDGPALTAIGKASTKARTAIQRACQGPDKLLGTADDLTPAEIGFGDPCLDVTVPGAASCMHAVATLADLMDCVGCVSEFETDCAADVAVPPFVSPYPPECNAGASATPTPGPLTPTPTSATPTRTPTPIPTATAHLNRVFVTSSLHAANFGSAAQADTVCQAVATNEPLAGTYVAWLSDGASLASSRLGAARGFVRMDGKPFADQVSDITAGKILNTVHLTEQGNTVSGTTTPVWTGTNADGTLAADTCLDWTSTGAGAAGLSGRTEGGVVSWTSRDSAACNATRRLYCFQTDFTTPLTFAPATGKVAFYTVGMLTPGPGIGIAAADTLCADEASAAGLAGTFQALLATSTASAISRFPGAAGNTYVRPDGIVVASGPTLAAGSALQSGIWQHADGTYGANSNAWTGANDPSSTGTAASTCDDWMDATSTSGIGGAVTFTDTTWWKGFTTGDCTKSFRVYCLEE